MLEAIALTHRYANSHADAPVLRGVDLALRPGEVAVVCGPSGAGKSTLLFVLAGLLTPTSGVLRVDDRDLYASGERFRRRLLRRRVRLCLQQFRLAPYLTAAQNVRLGGAAEPRELLEEFGVGALADRPPARLSAGEQQRVALAQALACGPELLLADEPTSSLDGENKSRVYAAVRGRCERGMAALIAAHDTTAVEHADRVYRIQDGELHED